MSETLQLIFATHNQHKVEEINALLPSNVQVLSLKDLNYLTEIPETGATLEENAEIKAKTIYNHFQKPVMAEDTGLEVDFLDGAPGVYSARYAGPKADSQKNIQKLLKELERAGNNRKARFRTVIVCILDGVIHTFTGEVQGFIANTPSGQEGFGYDPIFIPLGFNHTFAELGPKIKSRISHRSKAWRKVLRFLQNR